MYIEIQPYNTNPRQLKEIVDVLQKGGIIAIPTDTVYAAACALHSKKGMEKLAKFKGVKLNKAKFSVIAKDLAEVSNYTKQLEKPLFKLLKHNLPGPFTFILPANNDVSKLFDANKKEIGIRIPDHPLPQLLCELVGGPLVTTSLHDDEDQILEYFLDPQEIFQRFEHELDAVIDGGPGQLYASTIVDCCGEEPEIIRQGIGELRI